MVLTDHLRRSPPLMAADYLLGMSMHYPGGPLRTMVIGVALRGGSALHGGF